MIGLVAASFVSFAFLFLTLPPLLYLGLLAALSLFPRRPPIEATTQRFVIVVPAHNEEANIRDTVESLLGVHYPRELFSVLVVADNCRDATASVARAAGAQVLERTSATERGKGFALHFAFEHILQAGSTDAVVVVDADSVVSANCLRAFAARLVDGELAMQGEYGVRNPYASWRTRLMAVALGMFHRVRGIARERLRLSAGLRGNGMCFAVRCLQRFPHDAHGLVEDVEYGIALGRGGVRIAYVDEAQILGEMVSGGQASESQRARWEEGRRLLWRQTLPLLLRQALSERSGLLLDLAIDLAIPPLGRLGGLLLLGTLVEGLRTFLFDRAGMGAEGLIASPLSYGFVAAWCGLLAYVGRGMALSHLGLGAITAMLGAPAYLVWKILLAVRARLAGSPKANEWVRTAREQSPSKTPPEREPPNLSH